MGDGGAWDLSCRDWEARIREGRSLVPALPLFEAEAARVTGIFNRLRLPDVPGTPTLAEACGPWFGDIVHAFAGALNPETQQRIIRELFVLVAKKNSKTSYGAVLMVALWLAGCRPRGEYLFVGPTQAIADTGFEQAKGSIELDPWLSKRVHIQDHMQRMTIRWHNAEEDAPLLPGLGAQLKIKTFDTKVLTGSKPVGVLIDELHELASIPKAARVIGQIRGGILARREGFLIFITTQSEDPPRGVFKAELARARAIRDGRMSGDMLPVLYEMPPAMVKSGAWRDPATWHMVNPNLGRSVTLDQLVADWEKAQADGDEEMRRWASQHLNVEIGLALHSDRWPGADFWEAAVDDELTLDSLLERSEVAVAGIDGGGLDDLLGLAVVGREKETRRWLSWGHAWAHASVLERRKSEASKLIDLQQAGELTIVKRLGDDIDELVGFVRQVDDSGLLSGVGLDPIGVGAIVDALAEARIGGKGDDRVVGVSQGYKLNGAIKTAERKLADGTLVHADQALMDWAVGNAKVEPRGNAVVITKQASGTAKIDPLLALLDAVALMSLNPATRVSIYRTRGLLVA